MPSLTHLTSLPPQSQVSLSFKSKSNHVPPALDPTSMEGLTTMSDIDMSALPPLSSTTLISVSAPPETSDTTTPPLSLGKSPSPLQQSSNANDAEASSSTEAAAKMRPQLPSHSNLQMYHPPSSLSVPPETTSTFRVAPKKPKHNHQTTSFTPPTPAFPVSGNSGSAGGNGSSEERPTQGGTQPQRQSAYGLAPGTALTYDSFWSSHGTGSGRSTPTPVGQRVVGGGTVSTAARGRSIGGSADGIANTNEGGRGDTPGGTI